MPVQNGLETYWMQHVVEAEAIKPDKKKTKTSDPIY